jgi:ferredoxin
MSWIYDRRSCTFGVSAFREGNRDRHERRFAVAFVIAKPCIGVKDTACVAVCPVDVIHPVREEDGFESAEQLYIDPNGCIDCGLCAGECPVNAIFAEDDLPEEWQEFIAKNAEYYAGK